MKTTRARSGTTAFTDQAKALAVVWIALLLLMSASLGLSYVHLGTGNVVAGIGIACVKTAPVGWWFMHLRSTQATSRAAGVIALLMLAIWLTLSAVDYMTRLEEPATVQVPQQLAPLVTPRLDVPTK